MRINNCRCCKMSKPDITHECQVLKSLVRVALLFFMFI